MKPYPAYIDSGVKWIGKIPKYWSAILFKRVIAGLKDGTHGTYERVGKGKPLLSAKNIFYDGIRISETESLISEDDFKEITKNGFPQINDLLLTIVGTIGRVFVYDKLYPLAFQRSVLFVRLNDKAIPQYYYYLAQSILFYNQLISSAKTSAQSGVYMKDVSNLIVLLPQREDQITISEYLDHKTHLIDTLIEKKQKQIELLQEQRSAIINQAVTKGLNPNVKMKDSGIEWLGEVPEHWQMMKLAHFVEKITNGYVGPTRDIMRDEGIPYVQGIHIKDNTVQFTPNGYYYVSKEWSDEHHRSILKENDVLVVQTGSIGEVGIVPKGMDGANCHALIILRANPEYGTGKYLMWLLSSSFGFHSLMTIKTGDILHHLNSTRVRFLKLPVPPKKEQIDICQFIEKNILKIRASIEANEKQIELLTEFRTTLISEVVTGKIDVRDEVIQ